MKVIKHCANRFPTTATGSLVGMDINGTIEVTNTFPFPSSISLPRRNTTNNTSTAQRPPLGPNPTLHTRPR